MLRIVLALLVLGAAAAAHAATSDYDCAYDPKTTHLSRIVAANSTGGPIYGVTINDSENKSQRRTLDLHDHEIVLTFDDGPLGANTQSILDTLQRHCVKAIFFSVGKMAMAQPKLIQEVDRRGHTIGSHTWSHPRAMHQLSPDDNKLEIEKGFTAVSEAVGKPIAPFFRFPGFRDSRAAVTYLASRNISVWGTDVISGDADAGGVSAARITRTYLTGSIRLEKASCFSTTSKSPRRRRSTASSPSSKRKDISSSRSFRTRYYQPDPQLVARTDVFRNTPETATITGRWLASPKEEVKDGSVDVMHTEWIDLDAEIANEKLNGAGAGVAQPHAEAQPGTMYTANGWAA